MAITAGHGTSVMRVTAPPAAPDLPAQRSRVARTEPLVDLASSAAADLPLHVGNTTGKVAAIARRAATDAIAAAPAAAPPPVARSAEEWRTAAAAAPQDAALPSPAAHTAERGGADVSLIADRVMRRMLRQVVIERERRGE